VGGGLKERPSSELLSGCVVCWLIAISTQPAVNNKGNLQINPLTNKGTRPQLEFMVRKAPFPEAVTGAIFTMVCKQKIPFFSLCFKDILNK